MRTTHNETMLSKWRHERGALPTEARATRFDLVATILLAGLLLAALLDQLEAQEHAEDERRHCVRSQWDGPTRDSPQQLVEQPTNQTVEELCRAQLLDGRQSAGLAFEHELCYAWRFKYIEEQSAQGNEVKILDESLDERVANSIYTAISVKPVDFDFFAANSGDRKEDARNLEALASGRTHDRLCGQHLSAMVEMLEQFGERLARKRANASSHLGLEERHIRLARVLDAFGRYESGFMLGKTHSMGSFDQCVTSRMSLFAGGGGAGGGGAKLVGARFCWARMSLRKHLNALLKARQEPSYESREKVLMLGTCLPESCHSRSFVAELAGAQRARENSNLAQRLIDSQFKLPKSLFLDESLEISSIYCLVDGESHNYKLPPAGKLVLAFIVGWLLLTAYATYQGESRPQVGATNKKTDDLSSSLVSERAAQANRRRALFDCLNLKRSWQDFVDEPYDELRASENKGLAPPAQRPVSLDVLNPVKAFGCGFVVLGHAVIIQSATSMDGLRAFNKIENDPAVVFMIVGTVIVDTFFVITGLLMAFLGLQRARGSMIGGQAEPQAAMGDGAPQSNGSVRAAASDHRTQTGSRVALVFLKLWAKFAIQRHLRLVPLLLLVYAVKRTIFLHWAAYGQPLWDNGLNGDTLAGACRREPWWAPLTMQAAFLPLSKQCLPQAWSISSDLFFSLVVTPLVLLLTRKPKLALAIALLMGSASQAWTLRAYYAMPKHMALELSRLRAHGFAFMFGHLHNLYTFPHFRLGSILVGVLAGYALHLFQERGQQARWPGWIRDGATKAAFSVLATICLAVPLLPMYKARLAPYEFEVFAQLFTSGRIVWAASNAILFLRMATDWRHSFLMRQFAAGYWSRLVKLNLAILLVHMDVLMLLVGNSTSLTYFTVQNIFVLYGAVYLFCVPVAILLHVIFENPVDKLMKRHIMPHILP